MDDLERPVTEVEGAQLLSLLNHMGRQRDYAPADVMRRLLFERDKLYAAIRKHRDERGDDRCWMDDERLYQVLPEGYTPPERDCYVELINCIQFQRCRRNPATEYVSPQRRIEELEAEVARLKEALR